MAKKFLSDIELDAGLVDVNGNTGTLGQILSSTGTAVDWVNQGDVVAGEADKALSLTIRVKNTEAVALTKGQVVCAAPSATPPSGNVIEVKLADNNGTDSMPAIGVLNEGLDAAGGANDEGEAIMFGRISGIDTSAFAVGDEVFVSDTAGALTATKPTGVKYIQKIGVVIRDDATNGTIEVFGAGRTNDVPTPLYIDHANQRLGIGTTSPGFKLDVVGEGNFSSYVNVGSSTGIRTSSGWVHLSRYGDTNQNVAIGNDGTDVDLFVPNGKVGIGTNSPAANLHVYSSGNGEIEVERASGALINLQAQASLGSIGTDSNHPLYFKTNGGTRVAIATSGNVGIGTTSPGEKLDVAGNIAVSGTVDGVDIAAFKSAYDNHNHNSTYLGISAKAADSNLLDGIDSGSFLRSDADDTTTGIITFAKGANGTLASRTGYSDFIGYNPSYGSYIGGGAANASGKYLYAGGYINNGTSVYTLWHSGNDGSGSGLDADTLDGIQGANFLRSDTSDTMTGDLTIQKTNPLLKLVDNNTSTGNYPAIEFETSNSQGVRLEHNEFDSELPISGYGLVLKESDGNSQFPSTGTLSLSVLGEIYAGATTLGSLNKVFHDGYHPNADKWTTARTITLGGDLTGSVSIDGSSNVTLSAQVVNNSHTHDDRYVELTGDTMTGSLTIQSSSFTELKVDQTDSAAVRIGVSSGGSETFFMASTTGSGHSANSPVVKILGETTAVTEYARFTSTGLGIGTTSPGEKLQVIGNIGAGDGTYNGGVYANLSSTSVDTNWGFDFLRTAGQNNYSTRLKYYPTTGETRKGGIWNSRNNNWVLYGDSNNTPNVIIPSGNVGIGTTSPGYKLDVSAAARVHGVRIGRDFSIANRGTVRIDANGTGSPSDVLFGHTAAANESYWTGVYWSLSSRGTSDNGKFQLWRGSGHAAPYNSELRVLTALPNGNIGIGATDPSEKLNVDGNILATGTILGSNLSGTNTGDQDLSGYLTTTGKAADSNLLDGIDSSGFVKQLSDTSSPDYTTPSSRRVNPNATNPTNEHYAITTFGNNGNVTGQLATHFVSGLPYTRGFNASWSPWRKIWTDANDGSGSGLDADTLDGQHASAFLTSLPSHNHDDRYYTESESDSRFVNTTSDTMSGTLVVGGGNGIGDGKMAVRGGDLLLDRGKELRWNTGTGSGEYIYSKTSSPYDVTIHSGSYDALQAPNTGEVRINYQGAQKFVTNSSGVSITGNITVSGTGSFGSTVDAASPNINNWIFKATNSDFASESGFYDANNHVEMILRNSSDTIAAHIKSSGSSYFNGGNVGIGTTGPSTKLHVNGNTYVQNDIRIGSSFGATNQTGIIKEGGTSYGLGFFTWGDTAPIQIGGGHTIIKKESGGNANLYVTGNVGIGTDNPQEKLDVNGNIYLSGLLPQSSIIWKNPVLGTGPSITTNSAAYLIFETPGAGQAMTIENAGDVGIGTTNPGEKLEVNGNIKTTQTVTQGTTVTFTKPNNSTTYETIATNIAITRGYAGAIYNPLLEGGWEGTNNGTPSGLLFNIGDGWSDLSDVATRTYVPFGKLWNYSIGGYIVNEELVMWDYLNNEYHKIKFTSWTAGGGGGFVYERTPLTLTENKVSTDVLDVNHQLNLYGPIKAKNRIEFDAEADWVEGSDDADNNYTHSKLLVDPLLDIIKIGNRVGYNINNGNVINYENLDSRSVMIGGNIAVGSTASNTAKYFGNVFIGNSIAAATKTFDHTANYNVALGYQPGYNMTSATDNVLIGRAAGFYITGGDYNVAIGYASGQVTTTGSNNVSIGRSAVPSSSSVSNTITLGNSSITTLRCQVTSITSLSDQRDKTNIEPSTYGLNVINKLNPVTFDWDMRDGGKVGDKDLGFIAQDLQQVDDENLKLVYDDNPEKLEASYGRLIPVMTKAIQELSAKIEELQNEIQTLKQNG